MSANTETDLVVVRTSLATAEQLLAERDKRIAQLERHIDLNANILTDTMVGNQAAWIEWKRGRGADEAMQWIENGLCGPGLIPGKDEPWATEPQAWFDANKAEPLPTCFCGRPSNTATMSVGFCSEAHYGEWKSRQAAEAAGATGMPLFDGATEISKGGAK